MSIPVLAAGLRKRLATAAATKTAGKAAAIVLKWSTRAGVDKAVRVPAVGRVAASVAARVATMFM